MSEVVTISKEKYLGMKKEIDTLRKTKLYERLLEFEENIRAGRIYTRKDLISNPTYELKLLGRTEDRQ